MLWVFALVGLVLVLVMGLVVVGRETARLADAGKPAVFELYEAVDYIADRLPPDTQARLSHDDVRWILLADADQLDDSTHTGNHDSPRGAQVVDEVDAVARIITVADRSDRDLDDGDVAAVLDGRLDYLAAIGAVGPEVQRLGERP